MASPFEEYVSNKTLRSTYLPPDIMSGSKIYLIEEGDWFTVLTVWQIIGRRKRLNDAIALFERTLVGR